jgi:hypothetical protein
MKIAVVVQRYGADINGGAELHARYIAEHLAQRKLSADTTAHDVRGATVAAGVEQIGSVTVRRFPVARARDVRDWASIGDGVHADALAL